MLGKESDAENSDAGSLVSSMGQLPANSALDKTSKTNRRLGGGAGDNSTERGDDSRLVEKKATGGKTGAKGPVGTK